MKKLLFVGGLIYIAYLPVIFANGEVFKQEGCMGCHSITSQNLANPEPLGGDLSAVGSKYEAKQIYKFLKKEIELDEREHPKKFKGKNSVLKELSIWLASLKGEDKK